MHVTKTILAAVATAIALGAAPAIGQTGGAAEASIGYAGFLDDAVISHTLAGGSVRWNLTPRLALGPEIVYLIGPAADRDLFVTGNITFDLRAPSPRGRPALVPYLVAGAGLSQHRNRFGGTPFTSYEGAFTAGGGARVWVSRRTYLAGEVRAGWEPHIRYSAHAGVAFGG